VLGRTMVKTLAVYPTFAPMAGPVANVVAVHGIIAVIFCVVLGVNSKCQII
jgi:hypothetical protein